MESDKKSFDTDELEQQSSDFLEYQHKKLEKVAAIIKEEERAAKLLEETENAALENAPTTTVVIDSIVKHDNQEPEPQSIEADDNVVDGLYIEPIEQQVDMVDAAGEENKIPDDNSTFEAIDEVIQAAQNDFEASPEPELSVDESDLHLEPDEDSHTTVELALLADEEALESESNIETTTPVSPDVEDDDIEMVDGLAITASESLQADFDQVDETEDEATIDDTELVINDVGEDALEEEQASTDAIVDFVAAEEATEAEAVEQSVEVDYAQPKISKIGRLLLELGKISRSDTKKILRTQKKHGLLFGDAALKLGLINDDDIQKVVAMQFNYHYLQAGQGKFSDDLVAAYAPFSKKVENYRALRSQLMMRWFKKGHRALAIVGANSGDGVSYLTANLGVVFSQLGARTLIIEANMRSPRHQEIFNIRTHSGLSDMIVGKIGSEAIQEIESIPDLSVLHAGTVPPNPQELLGRTSFNILFKNLSDDYDVILIDTPPVVQSADAQSVIEMSEGAMLVSRLHQTKHTDVLEMRHLIEMTGASIVSAVMNDF